MTDFRFFVGLHQPADAKNFPECCISINRLRGRKKPVECPQVLVDSGAFTELNIHGCYRHDVEEYAAELIRLHDKGVVKIAGAVAQDYMCEPFMLEKTGLDIETHQRLSVERYDGLLAALHKHYGPVLPFVVLPVLQGYDPEDYQRHVKLYGARLTPVMWAGVGSVCKRNGRPESVLEVLRAVKDARPDLRLHGFGIKKTSLSHPGVRELLATSDSMAWSLAARKEGRDGNSWAEAFAFRMDVLSRVYEMTTDHWIS